MIIKDDNQEIYTGGDDGSVYVWRQSCTHSTNLRKIMSTCPNSCDVYNNNNNNPKYISFLNSGRILVFNEKRATLVCYDKEELIVPNELLYLDKYHSSSYCIMQVSPCRSFVAFASKEGYLTIYKGILS